MRVLYYPKITPWLHASLRVKGFNQGKGPSRGCELNLPKLLRGGQIEILCGLYLGIRTQVRQLVTMLLSRA